MYQQASFVTNGYGLATTGFADDTGIGMIAVHYRTCSTRGRRLLLNGSNDDDWTLHSILDTSGRTEKRCKRSFGIDCAASIQPTILNPDRYIATHRIHMPKQNYRLLIGIFRSMCACDKVASSINIGM